MKSINFSKQGFQQEDILTRLQMKRVKGGHGTCQALVQNSNGDINVIENQTAGSASSAPGMLHWCCDSCCTASWSYKDNC
ncbi:MAG: hypothetical protein Q7U77_14550 [Sediminibacterium sp.]|uniref:hypothetical protein n=1 Tax=Sediminibacterium sp. TaxID=1917865 RepID=UPI0027218BCE|nr:hypothetical protein [Sediminibacterium sp.]MDO8997843.1 hypothetical protein [Sediminibacterium sp.]